MSNNRKNKIYGNWTVLSINGDELFKCLEKRANWYLSRNLATQISENPPKIQLNFEVKGEGNKEDEYYLSPKKNICVKCGIDNLDILTKHHIVPQMYRRFFPLLIKSRNSFDVVPICFDHHDEYEKHADKLKHQLAEKYNAPIDGIIIRDENKCALKAIRSANALEKHGERMPHERRNELLKNVREYLNKYDILDEDIKKLSSTVMDSDKITKAHGEIVVEQISDYQSFVEMWRFHFLEKMKPEFMPEHWNPKRSISKK